MNLKHFALRRLPPYALFILLLLGLTALAGAPPSVARAAEDWKRYNGWELTSLRLEGVPKDEAAGLRRGLALNGQWRLLRGQQRPQFSARLLAADTERIRLYLAIRGYPHARIEAEATPRRESRRLALLLRVDPGPLVRVGAVRYENWPPGLDQPDSLVSGLVRRGEVFRDDALRKGRVKVRTLLQNAGYAQAEVGHVLHQRGLSTVDVHFAVNAGERFSIDTVEVSGCSPDLEPLALRIINIAPGTWYAVDKLDQAVRDLRLTQLFRQVDFNTTSPAPGSLSLAAELEDGAMRTWNAALGTWSDNPWVVKASWTHRNLLGGGRGVIARGEFATHESRLGAGLFWLGWLSPRAVSRLGTDFIAEDEDAYEAREYRVELVQSFRPRNRDVLNVGTALSENRITEREPDSTELPEQQGRLWEFWSDVKWDRTDDPLIRTRGGFLKLSVTVAEPWLLSDVPYVSARVDVARYAALPLGLIATGRMRVGVAGALKTGGEVLANRRFYAGGYNTHRGYQRRGLGPRDQNDQSRGGEAVLLFGGEVRLPAVWLLEAAFFVDSGNVWADHRDIDLAEFPVAAGACLGVRTPLGPLRLGYAVNVADLVPGQPRRLWHFGIGYPW